MTRFGQVVTHERSAPAATRIRRAPGFGPVFVAIEWEPGVTLSQRREVARRLRMVRTSESEGTENYMVKMTGDFVDFQVALENEPTIFEAHIGPAGGINFQPMFGLGGPEHKVMGFGGLIMTGLGAYLYFSDKRKKTTSKKVAGITLTVLGLRALRTSMK